MNFYDKITELDYQIKTKNDNCIYIVSEQTVSNIIIIFDNENKRITGYLKPNDIIKSLEDITHQYSLFRKLQNDLKELSSLCKYDIV